jgi:hypothetical protein
MVGAGAIKPVFLSSGPFYCNQRTFAATKCRFRRFDGYMARAKEKIARPLPRFKFFCQDFLHGGKIDFYPVPGSFRKTSPATAPKRPDYRILRKRSTSVIATN